MKNLLLFFVDEDHIEYVSELVGSITLAALALFVVVMLLICLTKKNFNTKSVTYGAICVAASFALSFLKVSPVVYGGSITLASLVPVMMYAYCFGLGKGLLIGLVTGLLNFIQSPYILTPVTFLLDYVLAFSSIGLMGLARKFGKNTLFNVLMGVLLVYGARFLFHFVSGLIYFDLGQVWAELPKDNGIVYSLLYNVTYLVPDAVIAGIVFTVMIKTNNFQLLMNLMNPPRKVEVLAGEVASQTEAESTNAKNDKTR